MEKNDKKIKKRPKEFQVDYLRIFDEKIDSRGKIKSNNIFKLSEWFETISRIPVKSRKIKYNNEVIRLQNIEKVKRTFDNLKECDNIWRIHFIRIKTNSMSGVATEDGEFDEKLLNEKLADNQFLAESTGCIYDGDKELLIVARNRDAVLPSAILEFFKKTLNNNDLTYAIIPNKLSTKANNEYIYRRLIIGITDVDNISKKDNSFLKEKVNPVYNAIKGFEGCGYCNIKIELSMGDRPKNQGMNQKVKDIGFGLAESEIKNLKKLEMKTKEDIDTKVETVDLINNKVKDNFTIRYSRIEPILYSDIIDELLESYNNKKKHIDNLIK